MKKWWRLFRCVYLKPFKFECDKDGNGLLSFTKEVCVVLVHIPAPGVLPITCQGSQLIIGIRIFQVAVVCMIKHGLYSVPVKTNTASVKQDGLLILFKAGSGIILLGYR